MTRLEGIARDLAAVLSPEGESDWRRFVGMAEEVGTRLFRQLAEMTSPGAGPGVAAPAPLGRFASARPQAPVKRLQRLPVRPYAVQHRGPDADSAPLRRGYH